MAFKLEYVKWNSVRNATEGHDWPSYRGFYTLTEALAYAREKLGPDYYIKPGDPISLFQESFNKETVLQEEEITQLKKRVKELEDIMTQRYQEIQFLHDQLAQKSGENMVLMEANNDYLMRIAKHQKKGIPYCNRTLECLSVRLKMPQFTCLTLQPLFEACPEVQNIIAEKARIVFYQNMIKLQNLLALCDFNDSYR